MVALALKFVGSALLVACPWQASATEWVIGDEGASCDDTCEEWKTGAGCDPAVMNQKTDLAAVNTLAENDGYTCGTHFIRNELAYLMPAVHENTQKCMFAYAGDAPICCSKSWGKWRRMCYCTESPPDVTCLEETGYGEGWTDGTDFDFTGNGNGNFVGKSGRMAMSWLAAVAVLLRMGM